MIPGTLGITLDEIKVLYADAMLEAHVLRKEVNRLAKENSEQAKTIKLLGEKLPTEGPTKSAE